MYINPLIHVIVIYLPPCLPTPTSWRTFAAKSHFCLELSYLSELSGISKGRYSLEIHTVPRFSVSKLWIVIKEFSTAACKCKFNYWFWWKWQVRKLILPENCCYGEEFWDGKGLACFYCIISWRDDCVARICMILILNEGMEQKFGRTTYIIMCWININLNLMRVQSKLNTCW